MIEAPNVGFTGVIWGARPADQLARDLTTGPGPVPMADAATSWTRIAEDFGEAALEYDQIVTALRGAWRSGTSEGALERISTLRGWILDAATGAGTNAQKATVQATAYEVARLAMPDVAEVAALQHAQQTIGAVAGGLGGPLVAAAAHTDAKMDVAKATAARVMQTYEAATAPLAASWTQQPPPAITSGAALAAERIRVSAPAPNAVLGLPTFAVAATQPFMTTYNTPIVEESIAAVERDDIHVVSEPAATAAPVGPAGPMATTGVGADEQELVRAAGAADGYGNIDLLGLDTSTAAAVPAVLGGAVQVRFAPTVTAQAEPS
jgi:hypothetical protein